MKNDEDDVLQPGPRRSRDASNSPDVYTAMESDLDLESWLGSRTEPELLLLIASQLMFDIEKFRPLLVTGQLGPGSQRRRLRL